MLPARQAARALLPSMAAKAVTVSTPLAAATAPSAARALSTSIVRLDGVEALWQGAKAVCFDVDSTVVTEEGIDVLADHCGAGEAVAAWTAKAMGGSVPFDEALKARLELFKPSQLDIEACLEKHPLELTPGVATLIETLHSRDVHVYLVSGGFRQMINPLADLLNISRERVFANNILFGEGGAYAGFDDKEPTAWAGGKAKVVAALKQKHAYSPIFMVGDGATDMEARPPADAFIGFGGIAVRDVVKANADWYVEELNHLIEPLQK